MPAGSALIRITDPLTGQQLNPLIRPPPEVLARLPLSDQQWYQQRQEAADASAVRHPGAGNWPNRPANWITIPISTPQPAPTSPSLTPSTGGPATQLIAPQIPTASQTTPAPNLAQLLAQGRAAPPATVQPMATGPHEVRQSAQSPIQQSALMSLFNFPTLRRKKPAQATGGSSPLGAGQYNENFWNAWRI